MTQYTQATLDLLAKYHLIPQDDGTVFLAFKYTRYAQPGLGGVGGGFDWPTPDDPTWKIYGYGYTVNSDSLVYGVPTYYATLQDFFNAVPFDWSNQQFFEAGTNNASFFEYAAYETEANALRGSLNGELGYFLNPSLIGSVESHPSSAWVDFREGLLKQFIIPVLVAGIASEYELGNAGAAEAAPAAAPAESGSVDTLVSQAGSTGAISDTTTFASGTGAVDLAPSELPSPDLISEPPGTIADAPAVITPASKDSLINTLSQTLGKIGTAEQVFNKLYTMIKGPSGQTVAYQRTAASSGSTLQDSGLGANVTPALKQLAIPAIAILAAFFL